MITIRDILTVCHYTDDCNHCSMERYCDQFEDQEQLSVAGLVEQIQILEYIIGKVID